MRGKTHFLFAFILGLFWFRSILFAFVCAFSSLIPDIDSMSSYLGKRFKFFSVIARFIFGHRGFFHSILFGFLIFFFLYPFPPYSFAVFFGILSHLALDSLTPMGSAVFWPIHFRLRGPFKTGGFFESVFFVGLVVICVLEVSFYVF